MELINEAARETPIIHRTDVLVVGSGPGGLAAAMAAASSCKQRVSEDKLLRLGISHSCSFRDLQGWFKL